MMKLAIDSDSNGFELKNILVTHLTNKGIVIYDLNYLALNPEKDYPDVAYNLAKKIQLKEFDQGILICGTGQGMAMCANKVEGIYAGPCESVYSAERLRKSNNAQIITLGALTTGTESAKMIIDAWLISEFQGGRSLPKVNRMRELEKESFRKTQ